MKIVSWNVAGFRACLKKGFKKGYDSDFDEVAKSKQLQREEKVEKIYLAIKNNENNIKES